MASILILVVQETKQGIAVEQIPFKDGSPIERAVANLLDIGLKTTQEFIMQEISKASRSPAASIEGKHIEAHVSKALSSIAAVDFRKLLKEQGFTGP